MTASFQPKLLCVALVFLLTACSSTQEAYLQNFRLYMESNKGIALSNEQVTSSSVDLIYVKNGERPVATMGLAFIENGRYKWLSSDNVMIETAEGSLVRTLGLINNLVHVSHIEQAPSLLNESLINQKITWTRRIDIEHISGNDFGVLVRSEISPPLNTTLTIQGIPFSVRKVEEHVSYRSELYGSQEWKNTFWFNRNTNQLLQSSQTIAPNMDKLDITYVSRALRLLNMQSVKAE